MKKNIITMWKHFIKALPLTLVFMLLAGAVGAFAAAGTTDSSAAPGSTNSFSLEDIYQRLVNGTAGTQSIFTEPAVAPGTGSMHTLNDIMGAAPALDNSNGAVAAEVLSGQTFWGLTNGEWGLQTGSIATRSNVSGADGDKTFNIPNGYYSGNTATCNDSDLVAGNILASAEILGVTGSIAAGSNVSGADGSKTFNITDGYYSSNTATCNDTDLSADNIKSGVDILGTTGSLQGGCTCSSGTLIDSRWCDNGDGTVTDILGSGGNGKCLVWLMDAGCVGSMDWADTVNDDGAMSWVSILYDGSTSFGGGDCGLSDGSSERDWRLPTLPELRGLVGGTSSVRSGTPRAFSNVQGAGYWTSASFGLSDSAFRVFLNTANYYFDEKNTSYYVWPVRD